MHYVKYTGTLVLIKDEEGFFVLIMKTAQGNGIVCSVGSKGLTDAGAEEAIWKLFGLTWTIELSSMKETLEVNGDR